MFKAIKSFFVDKSLEERVKDIDADFDSASVKNAILWNIGKLAIENQAENVVLRLAPQIDQIEVEYKIQGVWKKVAYLPPEASYLQGIRFLTNSKMIADRRLPVGETVVTIWSEPAVYEVKITRDETHPVNLLEFTVSEITL